MDAVKISKTGRPESEENPFKVKTRGIGSDGKADLDGRTSGLKATKEGFWLQTRQESKDLRKN